MAILSLLFVVARRNEPTRCKTNTAIIAAGPVTTATVSAWPDLIVGLGIFALNLDASRQVCEAARDERCVAFAEP